MKGRRGHLVNLAGGEIGAENIAARVGNKIDLVARAGPIPRKAPGQGKGGRPFPRAVSMKSLLDGSYGKRLPAGVTASPPTPRKGLGGAFEHGPLRQGDNHAKRDSGREKRGSSVRHQGSVTPFAGSKFKFTAILIKACNPKIMTRPAAARRMKVSCSGTRPLRLSRQLSHK